MRVQSRLRDSRINGMGMDERSTKGAEGLRTGLEAKCVVETHN